jgi:Tfp pilus assembly protein PilV
VTRSSSFDRRSGFVLVELLLACIVFGVGVLALAGTAVVVARTLGDGARETRAVVLATARLERLRAAGCASASGSARGGGIQESWSAAPAGANVLLADSVQWVRGGGRADRAESFRVLAPC